MTNCSWHSTYVLGGDRMWWWWCEIESKHSGGTPHQPITASGNVQPVLGMCNQSFLFLRRTWMSTCKISLFLKTGLHFLKHSITQGKQIYGTNTTCGLPVCKFCSIFFSFSTTHHGDSVMFNELWREEWRSFSAPKSIPQPSEPAVPSFGERLECMVYKLVLQKQNLNI